MATTRRRTPVPPPAPQDSFGLSAKQVFQGFIGALLIAAVMGIFAMYTQMQAMNVEIAKQGSALVAMREAWSIFATKEQLARVEQKVDFSNLAIEELKRKIQK